MGETGRMAKEDPIAAALAKLEAALGSLTWGEGVSVITQERLQHFLWYGLPMKWLTDGEHHRRIASALARPLDLLDLLRYAALCRSATTAEVLDAYDRSDADGKKAFHRAHVASGIRPPDVDGLQWGSVMGLVDSDALSSTAELLELAVAAVTWRPAHGGGSSANRSWCGHISPPPASS